MKSNKHTGRANIFARHMHTATVRLMQLWVGLRVRTAALRQSSHFAGALVGLLAIFILCAFASYAVFKELKTPQSEALPANISVDTFTPQKTNADSRLKTLSSNPTPDLVKKKPAPHAGMPAAPLDPADSVSVDSSDKPASASPATEYSQRSVSAGMLLPYAESPDASLEDSVRQVDHALLQTLLRLELGSEDVRIEQVETRYARLPRPESAPQDAASRNFMAESAAPQTTTSEAYHFQRLRVFPAALAAVLAPSADFVNAFEQSLDTWAESARLERVQSDCARVIINGLTTHELLFGNSAVCPPDTPHVAKKPRIALVIDDMGMSLPMAEALLALKIPLAFSIWPHAPHARASAEMAFQQGQGVLVHQPMEPLQYPYVKPGSDALYVRMSEAEIAAVLERTIARVPHARGINNHMGSRFTSNQQAVVALCAVLRNYDLFVLDSLTSGRSVLYQTAKENGLPACERTVFLDNEQTVPAIRRQLESAERIALQNKPVIMIGHPYPATLKALQEWTLNRNPSIEMVAVESMVR